MACGCFCSILSVSLRGISSAEGGGLTSAAEPKGSESFAEGEVSALQSEALARATWMPKNT